MSTTQQLQVTGMRCSHCERAVRNAILDLDPQAQVQVDLPSGAVTVDSALSREAVVAAITEEGYEVA